MGDRVQSFGGEHTRRKLDVVAKYLAAYATVMKRQDSRLFYVDGFAGSGASVPKGEMQVALDPTLFPSADFVEGSPVRALTVDPPFDNYLFIDKKNENVQSLSRLQSDFPDRNIDVVHGDANDRLVEFCNRIGSERLDRAVVFLDPFGLSVRWDTIERIAATKKVDLWYLVPVDGMSRQIKDDGSLLPGAAKIDELWGSSAWRTKAVRQAYVSNDLFGGALTNDLRRSQEQSNFPKCFEIICVTCSQAGWPHPTFRSVAGGATTFP